MEDLTLEFDRVRPHRVLEFWVDELEHVPEWLRRSPERNDTEIGEGLQISPGVQQLVAPLGPIARIHAELREIDDALDGSAAGDAFRIAGYLELARIVRRFEMDHRVDLMAHAYIERAIHVIDSSRFADEAWDLLVPILDRDGERRFQRLVLNVAEVFPEWSPQREAISRFSRAAVGIEESRNYHESSWESPKALGALRDTVQGIEPTINRSEVRDGQFSIHGSPIIERAQGRIIQNMSEGRQYRVLLTELAITSNCIPSLGPLWIRLFSDGQLVAGGPLPPDQLREGATFHWFGRDFPSVDEMELWVNPYRYPSRDSLDIIQSPQSCAQRALNLSVVAARFEEVGSHDRWIQSAHAWLAAGYLDRAALAFHEAGEAEKFVWSRAPETRDRFQLQRGKILECLYWHPDVVRERIPR